MKNYFFALSLCSALAWDASASQQQSPHSKPSVPSLRTKIEAIAQEREHSRVIVKNATPTTKHRTKRPSRTSRASSLLKVDTSYDMRPFTEVTLSTSTASSSHESSEGLLLGGVPPEIWGHVLSYVTKDLNKSSPKERAESLQYRLVCRGFKELINGGTIYSLNLQAPAHLMQTVQFYEGKKFSLSGWVPRLSSLQERLPLSLNVKYGQVFISQLDDVDVEQPLYKNLSLTLTVSNTSQIEETTELLHTRGLSGTVRSREALWDAFDTTLNEDIPIDRAIKHNKDTFLPLVDLPNHEKIIRRIFEKGATEFRDTTEILAQIEDPTERTHIVSLLSKQILTNCPSISPLTFVITALSKVPNIEDRNQIVSYLSPRVLEKSKGVMGLATVIQSFSDIKTSPKRVKVASLLTDEVVSVCKNGMDLAPVIKTLGELDEDQLLPSIRVNDAILQECRDGRKLAETIKTSPRPLVSSGHFSREEAVF